MPTLLDLPLAWQPPVEMRWPCDQTSPGPDDIPDPVLTPSSGLPHSATPSDRLLLKTNPKTSGFFGDTRFTPIGSETSSPSRYWTVPERRFCGNFVGISISTMTRLAVRRWD
jgi:hypothetical protein